MRTTGQCVCFVPWVWGGRKGRQEGWHSTCLPGAISAWSWQVFFGSSEAFPVDLNRKLGLHLEINTQEHEHFTKLHTNNHTLDTQHKTQHNSLHCTLHTTRCTLQAHTFFFDESANAATNTTTSLHALHTHTHVARTHSPHTHTPDTNPHTHRHRHATRTQIYTHTSHSPLVCPLSSPPFL